MMNHTDDIDQPIERELREIALGMTRFGGDDGHETKAECRANAKAVGTLDDSYEYRALTNGHIHMGPGRQCDRCLAVMGIPCVCVWCDRCCEYAPIRGCPCGVRGIPSPWDRHRGGGVFRRTWDGLRETTPEGFLWGGGGDITATFCPMTASPLGPDLMAMAVKAVPLIASLRSVRKSIVKGMKDSSANEPSESDVTSALDEMSRVSGVPIPTLDTTRAFSPAGDAQMLNSLLDVLWNMMERHGDMEASGVNMYCIQYLQLPLMKEFFL